MLERLRHFMSEIGLAEAEPRHFDENDYRLAAAALLVHIVSIDGKASAAELTMLHRLLELRFELDAAATDDLIAAATRAEGEAVDLYHFTNLLMRSLNEEGRARIVEMMWELVYADGAATEFEESVIWRAADLLGISANERIALKHRAAAGRLAPDATNDVQ
jgi:uncharacterized tellurite resistance protein B-like protein